MTEQPVPIEEAARILGTSTAAIRKRIKRGTLTATKSEGGRWMIVLPGDDRTVQTTRTLDEDYPAGLDAG
jgi:excisionase family DNA binding protein